MFIDALVLLLIIIATFFFGYHTGRDHARDKAEFDRAASQIKKSRQADRDSTGRSK
jgi:hypothetical protein